MSENYSESIDDGSLEEDSSDVASSEDGDLEDDDDLEEDGDDRRSFASRALGALMGLVPPQRAAGRSLADKFKKLPLPPQPLRHELGWNLNAMTSGLNPPSHACRHVSGNKLMRVIRVMIVTKSRLLCSILLVNGNKLF